MFKVQGDTAQSYPCQTTEEHQNPFLMPSNILKSSNLTALSILYWQQRSDKNHLRSKSGDEKPPLIHSHTNPYCLQKRECFGALLNSNILTSLFVFSEACKTLFPHIPLSVWPLWHRFYQNCPYLTPIHSLWHQWSLGTALAVTALTELLSISRSFCFSCSHCSCSSSALRAWAAQESFLPKLLHSLSAPLLALYKIRVKFLLLEAVSCMVIVCSPDYSIQHSYGCWQQDLRLDNFNSGRTWAQLRCIKKNPVVLGAWIPNCGIPDRNAPEEK